MEQVPQEQPLILIQLPERLLAVGPRRHQQLVRRPPHGIAFQADCHLPPVPLSQALHLRLWKGLRHCNWVVILRIGLAWHGVQSGMACNQGLVPGCQPCH